MSRLIAIVITLGVFSIGVRQLFIHSQYWPPSTSGHILTPLELTQWLAVALVLGSVVGLAIGGIGAGIARLMHRPPLRHLKVGYVVGLNATAIVVLWLIPVMI
jgi:hypothetical protein